MPVGSIKQKGGKTVHAWAVEGDVPEQFELKSNLFEIEYPPRSGRFKEFPEIDRAEFFPEEIARRKINPAQIPFLDRLRAALAAKCPGSYRLSIMSLVSSASTHRNPQVTSR